MISKKLLLLYCLLHSIIIFGNPVMEARKYFNKRTFMNTTSSWAQKRSGALVLGGIGLASALSIRHLTQKYIKDLRKILYGKKEYKADLTKIFSDLTEYAVIDKNKSLKKAIGHLDPSSIIGTIIIVHEFLNHNLMKAIDDAIKSTNMLDSINKNAELLGLGLRNPDQDMQILYLTRAAENIKELTSNRLEALEKICTHSCSEKINIKKEALREHLNHLNNLYEKLRNEHKNNLQKNPERIKELLHGLSSIAIRIQISCGAGDDEYRAFIQEYFRSPAHAS